MEHSDILVNVLYKQIINAINILPNVVSEIDKCLLINKSIPSDDNKLIYVN